MLDKRLADVCERQGWIVTEIEGTDKVSLSKKSPAGEAFSFTVDAESIVGDIAVYYENFDVDEHAEKWIMERRAGKPDIPRASVLVRDAEDIEKMIADLYYALYDEQLGKRRFTVTYREHSIMTVDIMAESVEAAEIQWDNMVNEGKINFGKMDVYDSEIEIEEQETF